MTAIPKRNDATTPKQAAFARLRLALRGLNAAAQEQAREFRILRETMLRLGDAVNDMEAATLAADRKLKVIGQAAVAAAGQNPRGNPAGGTPQPAGAPAGQGPSADN